MLRPLPFPNSEALVAVTETDQQRGQLRGSYSFPNYFDLRDQNNVFENLACYHSGDFILTGSGDPARLQGTVVTSNLFSVLGVSPIVGRGFLPEDDKPNETGRTVVLSQRLFQRKFNSDPALINQRITPRWRGLHSSWRDARFVRVSNPK